MCDVCVEYKPRVRRAAVMRRQNKKKFGGEKKKDLEAECEQRKGKEVQKAVRKTKWQERGDGARRQ